MLFRSVGYGASGRNGGQVCTGFSSSQAKIEAQLGKADAAKAFAMAEESKALLTDRIARHRIDCDLRWGYLHTITKPSHQDELKAWKAELDGLGVAGTSLIGKAELEEKLGTRIYHGAMREQGAGHLHPLNYCLGLARAAVAAGATIHENSQVLSVDSGSAPVARTTQGSVRAKFLILAGNAYLRSEEHTSELQSH